MKRKRLIRYATTFVISTLLSLVFIGGIAFLFRKKIMKYLITFVPAQTIIKENTQANTISTEKITSNKIINTSSPDLTIPEVVSKVNKSVVSIDVSQVIPPTINIGGFIFYDTSSNSTGTSQIVSSGSGFFVSSNGLILTNRHVVDFDNATFAVTANSGEKYTATLIHKDSINDIALLKINGNNFPAVTLGDSNKLSLGQTVVAIGFALGQFKNTISSGLISGLGRSITAGDNDGNTETLDKVIQTDTAINPGNSGGPLINLKGSVIGVNVAMIQGSENIAFALPINTLKSIINEFK